jgi:uncharacterized protein
VRIVLAGGSGFLGQALRARAERDGHTITILTRSPRGPNDVAWSPDGTAGAWATALHGADAVVNLAGESIAGTRWNEARKRALLDSRLLPTRSIVAALAHAPPPAPVLVNGSAVGYYGAHGDERVSESTPPATDFLGELCVAWEREAEQASVVTRVALVRTGLVLHPDGGALGQMLTPFKLGAGGPMGSGDQYMPWIHLDDWVSLVVWLIATSQARGAFNGTAPEPVTNRAFARALGRALHRPALLPAPALALKLLLGEFADSLLTGQRAVPARAEELGFQFRFRDVDAALADLLP